ncbi:MAG: hypothetical protein Q9195_000647 [Heterodermia aff. obscurata]
MTANGIHKQSFDSIEETLSAFRRGEFIIVLDSTDRENEGDLIIAAEDITTEKMAFMIRHTRRPGHILPLRAREGGILERKGHTEAAVEFCRLASKRPAGVICELVEDGEEIEGLAARTESSMMRRDGCLRFGQRWGLKVCTIEDLVKYVEKVNGMHVCNGTDKAI